MDFKIWIILYVFKDFIRKVDISNVNILNEFIDVRYFMWFFIKNLLLFVRKIIFCVVRKGVLYKICFFNCYLGRWC